MCDRLCINTLLQGAPYTKAMQEDSESSKPKASDAQRKASKKYYEKNKEKWNAATGYNSTQEAKEARRKYDREHPRKRDAQYYRDYRKRKKLEEDQ